MITDEERRETADELRDQAEAWRSMLPDIRMSDHRLTNSIHMAFGLDDVDTTVHKALDTLADMIDRPTCRNIADLEKESFKCSRCGCRVVALGDRPDDVLVVTSEAFPVDWYSCPVCGAVVDDEGTAH